MGSGVLEHHLWDHLLRYQPNWQSSCEEQWLSREKEEGYHFYVSYTNAAQVKQYRAYGVIVHAGQSRGKSPIN
jgi:hypothetical protein